MMRALSRRYEAKYRDDSSGERTSGDKVIYVRAEAGVKEGERGGVKKSNQGMVKKGAERNRLDRLAVWNIRRLWLSLCVMMRT